MLVAAITVLASASPPRASTKPHILYVLADDFGWADADCHRSVESKDPLATPVMMGLIKAGVELDQHYAFKFW